MASFEFRALRIKETAGSTFTRSIENLSTDALPDRDVLIRVDYSSLNYKDALSASGNKGVTKKYPFTPGIDAAGTVAESSSDNFSEGDAVLVTGYDLGMNTPGGFGRYIRVPAEWIVKLPQGLTAKESMMFGTAGFTAALSLYKMEQAGQKPDMGPVLVTGASGGLGSLAAALFSHCGYDVIASTGKPEAEEYLNNLGARQIISRNDVNDTTGRPLLKSRWAGVVDTVGGNILSTAIQSTSHRGSVACCGNVSSTKVTTNVFPFILRGVNLLGIESAECPMGIRQKLWSLLAGEWKPGTLQLITRDCILDDLSENIDKILKGKLKGRLVVDLTK